MEVKVLNDYIASIKEQILSMGVQSGDILYVSSDMAGILKRAQIDLGFRDKEGREQFLNALIDMLKDMVGSEGTLLFPMYNWDFCKGVRFCMKTTRSKVGALNNFILENRNDFKRTRHPLYSFMVAGKDADYLCSLDNQEAFGPNSPFAYLDKRPSKQLALGVDMAGGITFFHYVEQLNNAPYRYHKIFIGEYEDLSGITEIRAYSQYVRDLSIDYEYILADDFLKRKAGLVKKQINGWQASVIILSDVKKAITDNLLDGAEEIYRIKNYDVRAGFKNQVKRYDVGSLRGYDKV